MAVRNLPKLENIRIGDKIRYDGDNFKKELTIFSIKKCKNYTRIYYKESATYYDEIYTSFTSYEILSKDNTYYGWSDQYYYVVNIAGFEI